MAGDGLFYVFLSVSSAGYGCTLFHLSDMAPTAPFAAVIFHVAHEQGVHRFFGVISGRMCRPLAMFCVGAVTLRHAFVAGLSVAGILRTTVGCFPILGCPKTPFHRFPWNGFAHNRVAVQHLCGEGALRCRRLVPVMHLVGGFGAGCGDFPLDHAQLGRSSSGPPAAIIPARAT